jgi:hypothetical protein
MELHTVVEGLPSGGVGATFPVVVLTVSVGMVPNGAAGVIAIGDIVVVDVGNVPVAAEEVATGIAVMEGNGRGGIAGGCGAGIVEPGKSDMNDEAGCADSVRMGGAVLPVADVEEAAGTVGAADGIVPIVAVSDD